MKTYARIFDGKVVEIILPIVGDDGVEVPIELRFTPDYVLSMVEITGIDPIPQEAWTYVDGVFAAPVPRAPTQQEIEATNSMEKSSLKLAASQAMTPILMALQLGDTDDAVTLKAKAWRSYYQNLEAVDVTVAVPNWPEPPQDV